MILIIFHCIFRALYISSIRVSKFFQILEHVEYIIG